MEESSGVNVERQLQAGTPCQLAAFPGQLDAGPPGRDEPWRWYLHRRSRGAFRRARRFLSRLVKRAGQPAPASAVFPTPLFRVGDRVRVRSAEEIRNSLDGTGGIKGCAFAAGMYQYCGKEFRVAKVVSRFFDEARFRMLRARNMVLLDGVHCDGSSLVDTRGCDRMCFYFWRTEWLESVDTSEEPRRA